MASPSLQDGIDRAGSAVALRWTDSPRPWNPPVVEPEYSGWRKEQAAWQDGVALMDLSYHMWDTFITGPDATRMLGELSANNYQNFAIDQAKQLVAVNERGLLVGDGILLRRGELDYTLTGRPTAQNWITYHAQQRGYDVELSSDPDCSRDPSHVPPFFRYQIQGPLAQQLIEKAFGGPLPETKFFHTSHVTLAGKTFRALRHGMAGQPGYEFIGDHADHLAVREALLKAGEEFGLERVGSQAYPTAQAEGGWVPAPTPAIYDEAEREYRSWLPLHTPDGMQPLNGSYYSTDIADYYVTPYEIDYGRSISFNHEFLGREALLELKDAERRHKVTLVMDQNDVEKALGADHGIVNTLAKQRVEVAGDLVGSTEYTAFSDPYGTMLSLALVSQDVAVPGAEVTVVWGNHPGGDTAPDADLGFARIRATVQPCPYNEFARAGYRKD
ncbi:vanillate/3-O-methylgallate O-demethylase [Promicromonospora sp. AC04]|uniref:aminomethyltransferase family protein n=1 Tax=Promicromonospora sp. AC04 TaxID=2135723 RepID=UPI000D372757|nr:aminomethyltransferase family protein [Promicromonospora sp. AC04]PUB32286.1 vanillate/3-O-methylgallate O-demethylase [Promicromonospora sp. AC04]